MKQRDSIKNELNKEVRDSKANSMNKKEQNPFSPTPDDKHGATNALLEDDSDVEENVGANKFKNKSTNYFIVDMNMPKQIISKKEVPTVFKNNLAINNDFVKDEVNIKGSSKKNIPNININTPMTLNWKNNESFSPEKNTKPNTNSNNKPIIQDDKTK